MYFWLVHSTHSDVVQHAQRTLAECTQFLCAMRAGFPEFCKLSRDFAQNLRDVDAGRALFSDLNAMLTRSSLSDAVQYAQRTLAECLQFFVRGACRISGILQTFRANFCANFE